MPRTIRIALVCVWAFGTVSVASPAPTPSARTVYVTVVDHAGRAVAGLSPGDFVVKEGGKPRAIASVTPATEKVRLALFVADSMVEQPLSPLLGQDRFEKVPGSVDRARVRAGLTAFVERMCPSAEIALFSVSQRIEKLVDFTSDPRVLLDVIRQLPRDQAPAVVPSESVLVGAKEFEKEKPARPAIVVAAPGGFGGADPEYLLSQVAKSGAQVWAVTVNQQMTVGAPFNSFPGVSANDVPRQSGGRLVNVLDLTGFHAAMQQVADDLSSQYLITYTLPDGVRASDRISVSLKRTGVTLRAPTRVPVR